MRQCKRWLAFAAMNLLIASLLSVSLFQTPMTAWADSDQTIMSDIVTEPYEIYPKPQQMMIHEQSFVMTDEINLIIETGIDESTSQFVRRIFSEQGFVLTEGEELAQQTTNVLLGVAGSGELADQYVAQHVTTDATLFDQLDPYILYADASRETQGTIVILGGDTDAAYYGLASLQHILNQVQDGQIRELFIEDYAHTAFRGFIEGFYGFPWSNESRKSLMRFGGQFKMNTYIFAPKDDPYHNSAWRTLYPAEELQTIRELVEVGKESKTEFVWAIHPGFNMIRWNQYDQELATLIAKLEQLYSIGVRQFGLFMDDISTSQSLVDKEKHVMLITDVADWAASKGDVRSLIYCPPFYNQDWTGAGGRPYLEALRDVPDNVEIIWTGKGVVGTVNATDMQWPKDAHGKDPYVWLNWPVNDYRDSRLMLGKGEVLKPGTHNISGVVSNPMGQAELSKVALFAVADFTWNVDAFDDEASWHASFKYIAPEVAEAFQTIAYHLSDPSPSYHGLVVGESENIKGQLEQFMKQWKEGTPVRDIGVTLLQELTAVQDAIEEFLASNPNEQMVREITPWLYSLGDVVFAAQRIIQAAIAIQEQHIAAAWEGLAEATGAFQQSKTYTVKKLNYPDVTVEAGSKRLVPFVQHMLLQLDAELYAAVDPSIVLSTPISSYTGANLQNMVDGDEGTYAYIQVVQQANDWYGLSFSKPQTVKSVRIVQGRNNQDHDIFQRGILEASLNGEDWTAIGAERSGYLIEESDLQVEAQYIRYRLTHPGIPGGKPDLWTAIREFSVNMTADAEVYTNVPQLDQIKPLVTRQSVQLETLHSITLESGQYIGVQLAEMEYIAEIVADWSNEAITFQISSNGVEWSAYDPSIRQTAAYFRWENEQNEAITFDLNKFEATFNVFADPIVTHNYNKVYSGQLSAIYDGDLTQKVWFDGAQTAGKFVQVDLGGLVDVHNVAVVIGDGEGDYFRQGSLQLSRDGTEWITITEFNQLGDRSLNFPEHEVPYRYRRAALSEPMPARYVRLLATGQHQAWLALNEIIVNEGIERPGADHPAFVVQGQGKPGQEALYAGDGRLSTFYTPADPTASGYLSYRLTRPHVEQLIILQNPQHISHAQLWIRDLQGWHAIGALDASFNEVDTSSFAHVLELKLEWEASSAPMIHEIIVVPREASNVPEPPEKEFPQIQVNSPAEVKWGEAFEVSLSFAHLAAPVQAQDLRLSFPADIFELTDVTLLHEQLLMVRQVDLAPGEVRWLLASAGEEHAIQDEQPYISFVLQVKPQVDAASAAIGLSQITISDHAGQETMIADKSWTVSLSSPEQRLPGDVNGDGRRSIGDLSLAAAYYGTTKDAADWHLIKHADLNGDGIIDILDLAAIAQWILTEEG